MISAIVWATYQLAMVILPSTWRSHWVLFALCFGMLILGIEIATVVLSPGTSTPFGILGARPGSTTMEALRSKGLVASESYRALRAFEVAPCNDEGSQYFIELADGKVLFLGGQYLFEYDPISDDPELAQPRSFPCTEFTLHRHRRHGGVLQIDCSGEVIEPSPTTPAFTKTERRKKQIPFDGEIVSNESFELILSRRLASAESDS
jgi:hypothetical protein